MIWMKIKESVRERENDDFYKLKGSFDKGRVKINQSWISGMRCIDEDKNKRELRGKREKVGAHWYCLVNVCPTSLTAVVLERWVVLVVG